MAAVVVIDDGHGLTVEVRRINQPKLSLSSYKPVSYHCIRRYFHSNIPFKQLHTSNKMQCFSYKGGCGVHGLYLSRCIKEELA